MGHFGRTVCASALLALVPTIILASANTPGVQQLITAIDSGQLAQIKQTFDAQAESAIGNLKNFNASRVIALASAREFARYFGAISNPTPTQRQVLTWLAAQPHLMPTLMSAVTDQDPPARVLAELQALGGKQNGMLDRYPDLTTALLVVWDKPFAKDYTRAPSKFSPDHIARLFAYFTDPRSPVRFNLAELCWQLQVYIVDLRVSDDDIQWVSSRYARHYSIGDVYFDVNYDDNAFYQGGEKKIFAHDYTLQNILQYGGVCLEQGYFASEVAKCLGVPACMCHSAGGGAGQAAHCWVGVVNYVNRQYTWDFDEGRYPDDLLWSADITDPQTHENLTDADVSLLSALQEVDPETRLLSALLLKSADLLPPERQFELAIREVEVSPGNRAAWVALADLGAKNQLNDSQQSVAFQELARSLVQHYPDFACQAMMRMVEGQPTLRQASSLERVAQSFPTRPDLRARVRLQQADLLEAVGHYNEAFVALNDVLTNDLNAGAIILPAMRRMDALVRKHGVLSQLVQIYDRTWTRMPVPDRSSYVYRTPYYVIGKTYLDLLQSLGDQSAAQGVRNRLMAVIPAGAELK
jgi:hypothetical protein